MRPTALRLASDLRLRLPQARACGVNVLLPSVGAQRSAASWPARSAVATTQCGCPGRETTRSLGARHLHTSAVTAGKVIPVLLADIGEGIAEVEVIKWYVKEGDRVGQFDKLLEVQSDKSTVDITSRYDGVVRKLHYAVGAMAKTGTAMLDLEEEAGDAEASTSAPTAQPAKPLSSAAAVSASAPVSAAAGDVGDADDADAGGVRALATPAVRRIAKESNVDISLIPGSGKDGRVTKEDILSYVAARDAGKPLPSPPVRSAAVPRPPVQATLAKPAQPVSTASAGEAAAVVAAKPSAAIAPAAAAPVAPAAAPAKAAATAAAAPIPSSPLPSGSMIPADTRHPVRGMQRAMVKSMTAAWAVPHFGYCDEVVVDRLMEARAALKSAAEARHHGLKMSYLPFIVKATSLALARFPGLNAQLTADGSEMVMVHRGAHNIGIAMDTPKGLVVPNIKAVQARSLLDIAQELGRLQQLAAAGRLGDSDLADGTFTLSNIGTVGGTYASPVLFMPQVAIGAIGKIVKQPRYGSTMPHGHPGRKQSNHAPGFEHDAIVAAHIMTVSWSGDHRVVDGATLARFSNAWKGYLEDPHTMLAELR